MQIKVEWILKTKRQYKTELISTRVLMMDLKPG